MTAPSVAIVGLGPRGISIVERLAAAGARHVDLHLIDNSDHGAGRVWDREQTRLLCMNTLADAVTLFTEPGSSVGIDVFEGPTLYGWIRYLRGERDLPAAHLSTLELYPPKLSDDYAEELARTRPESNPSRAIYGEYLRWVYEIALDRLDPSVRVHTHKARVNRIEETTLYLNNGAAIDATTTVLATGWVLPAHTQEEKELAAAGGTWVAPDNPLDQDYSGVPAGEQVLVRGLGMGFFDFMTLVTQGRGGRFIEDPSARSGLRYEPSGKEPHLVISSGRGYPFLPKSDYRSLPPAATLRRTRESVAKLSQRSDKGSINFTEEVWPAIVADAQEAGGDAFNLEEWLDPLGFVQAPVSPTELTEQIAGRMERDIAEAVAAWDSPLKAALWEISAARKPVSILGEQAVFAPDPNYRRFMSLGQMVGSGPPLFRTRELLALVDASLATFLGGSPTVTVNESTFTMLSPTTETPVDAGTLVDAWMHKPDIRRAADPLTRSLLADHRIRAFTDATGAPTASPEVDPATRRVVKPDGTTDPSLHVIGIPTHGQFADTTISPMPGTDASMLRETDATARDILSVIEAAR